MAYSQKSDARAATQETRKARTSADLATIEQLLAAHDWSSLINGYRVTSYVSMATEPPTGALLTKLAVSGISNWVPIMEKGRALAWGKFSEDLAVNNFGVAEPQADDAFELASVSALIIPAQRAGLDGSRLGRGAGYYDRALAQLPSFNAGGPKRIVVVFDDEVDESVPCDEWDEPMDLIVTPTRIITATK